MGIKEGEKGGGREEKRGEEEEDRARKKGEEGEGKGTAREAKMARGGRGCREWAWLVS